MTTCTETERAYLDAMLGSERVDLKALEAKIIRERIGLNVAGLGRLGVALRRFDEAREELHAARIAVLAGASGIPAAQALQEIEEELAREKRSEAT